MSDSFLKLIPTDPQYIPSHHAQSQALESLKAHVPDVDLVMANVSDEVEFIDAGENWGEIKCSVCGAMLDLDWWSEAMEKAYESQFQTLAMTVPCCESEVSLNNLHYEWAVGFSRFVLEAKNPNIADLADSVRNELEAILGCKTKLIWARI